MRTSKNGFSKFFIFAKIFAKKCLCEVVDYAYTLHSVSVINNYTDTMSVWSITVHTSCYSIVVDYADTVVRIVNNYADTCQLSLRLCGHCVSVVNDYAETW